MKVRTCRISVSFSTHLLLIINGDYNMEYSLKNIMVPAAFVGWLEIGDVIDNIPTPHR